MVKKAGFSIIELVVVIGLIGLLAIAMSAIMLTTIVSSNRVRTLTKIKQAGDYAIGQIQTLVRNARSITSCSSSPDQLTIINLDGGQTTIYLTADRIASNSGVFLTPDDLHITGYSLDCEPSNANPKVVTISFDLENLVSSTKSTERPKLHFETTAEIRNN